MADDISLRLANAETVEGKTAFVSPARVRGSGPMNVSPASERTRA